MGNAAHIYRSKKGFITYIPLIVLACSVAVCIQSGLAIATLITFFVFAVIFLPMFFNTTYTIKNQETLAVKCGWFVNISMDIQFIRKIVNTRSVLSSPALSLDRIEIFYNKFDSVIISPQNKANFIAELKSINPAIEY
jgi:cytosine/uracil/thiamine/allantoin permease